MKAFKNTKAAIAIIVALYVMCGSADFAYQAEMEAMHQHIGG